MDSTDKKIARGFAERQRARELEYAKRMYEQSRFKYNRHYP